MRPSDSAESPLAPVRLRTRFTKGAASKTAAVAMAYKLLEFAQQRWRRFNGDGPIVDVLAGAKFKDATQATDDSNSDDA